MIDKILRSENQYSCAELRLAAIKRGAEVLPLYGTVLFLYRDENPREEIELDYEKIVMLRKNFPVKTVLQIINNIQNNHESKIGKYTLPPLEVNGVESRFLKKDQRYEEPVDWPIQIYRLSYRKIFTPLPLGEPLVKLGLPYYPSLSLALNHFFGFRSVDSRIGYLEVFVPDYRARFESIRLNGKSISVKIGTRKIELKELTVKTYALGGGLNDRNPFVGEAKPDSSGEAKFEVGTLPKSVYLCLLSDEEIIDEWTAQIEFPIQKDIFLEQPAGLIEALIERGEDIYVEFKEKIDHLDKVLETVVAFANAKGGHILLGVDDDGRIVGCDATNMKELEERLRNAIESKCEPPTIYFELFEVPINEKKVIEIYVYEGEDKPYFLRDKGFLVRRGASNRLLTRNELDNIYGGKLLK